MPSRPQYLRIQRYAVAPDPGWIKGAVFLLCVLGAVARHDRSGALALVVLLLIGLLFLGMAARHIRLGATTGTGGKALYRDERPVVFWTVVSLMLLAGAGAVLFAAFLAVQLPAPPAPPPSTPPPPAPPPSPY